MRQLAAQGFEGLNPDECMEVVDFIAEFSATRELSPAALGAACGRSSTRREAGVDWRQLVASQLHEIGRTAVPKVSDSRTYDLECLRQVVEDYPENVADQEAAFRALTTAQQGDVLPVEEELGQGCRRDRHGTGGDGS